jgi:hypothetical protein
MTVVATAQIFQIINGVDDYIKVNTSLAQCIRDSLAQVQDLSSSSPYTSDMCFEDVNGTTTAVDSTSLNDFTGNMIDTTDTFLDACATAQQANKLSRVDYSPDFTFLTSTFHTAQTEFIKEFANYLTAFGLTLEQVEQPAWNSTTGYAVASSTLQGKTLVLVTKNDSHDFNVASSTNLALRRYRRMIGHITSCYTTVAIMISVIKGRYMNNSNFSGTCLGTLASDFTNINDYVNTLSNEGNDWLITYDDWYPEAREGGSIINYQQSSMLAALNKWRDDFDNTSSAVLNSITITDGGSGHAIDDILTLSGASSSTSAVAVVTLVTDGAITALEIINSGAGFVAGEDLTVSTSGSGTSENLDAHSVSDRVSLLTHINTMNTELQN